MKGLSSLVRHGIVEPMANALSCANNLYRYLSFLDSPLDVEIMMLGQRPLRLDPWRLDRHVSNMRAAHVLFPVGFQVSEDPSDWHGVVAGLG